MDVMNNTGINPSATLPAVGVEALETVDTGGGGKAKINPPIRPHAEVEKLWRHVAAGNVTLVFTDHVSWSEDCKTNPDMLVNASGAPGLKAIMPLFVKGALERGGSLAWAARLMAQIRQGIFASTT